MKKLLPILLLLCCIKLSAQDTTYISMISDSSEWYYGTRCCSSEGPGQEQCSNIHYKISIGEDTIYQGIQYNKIIYWDGEYNQQLQIAEYHPDDTYLYGFIREDSGKVYIRYLEQGGYFNVFPVDSERVVYDFNLLVGDTFSLPMMNSNYLDCRFIVTQRDSVNTLLGVRRRIKLAQIFPQGVFQYARYDEVLGVEPNDTLVWTEGIGSNKGLLHNLHAEVTIGGLIRCSVEFLCYKWDNEYIYGRGTCDFVATVKESKVNAIEIYPNPTDNSVTVKLPINNSSCTLQIFDLQGRVVKTETLSGNSQTIATENLPGGVYQVMVSAKNKLLCREKLVIVR